MQSSERLQINKGYRSIKVTDQ